MKILLTLLTTGTLLSISPAMAGQSADCDKAPVARADALAAAIEHDGRVQPLISFKAGSARLAPAADEQIAELAKALDDNPYLHIEIGLDADHGRSPELANERARAVRDALARLNAPVERVAVREVKPVAEIAKVEVAGTTQQCAVPATGAAGS